MEAIADHKLLLAGVLRHIAGGLGGALVGKGYMDKDGAEILTGLIMAAAAVVFSAADKVRTKRVLRDR